MWPSYSRSFWSGLPHLQGVPHLHVKWPLFFFWVTEDRRHASEEQAVKSWGTRTEVAACGTWLDNMFHLINVRFIGGPANSEGSNAPWTYAANVSLDHRLYLPLKDIVRCGLFIIEFGPLRAVSFGVYTYIHTYIHTHIHTYIHTYIHTFIHTFIHTYITLFVNAGW